MYVRTSKVIAALALAAPAHADPLRDALDVVRAVSTYVGATQEAQLAARIQRELDRVEATIALATALFENNPVRGGSIEAGVTAGGGFDIDRGGADVAAMFSAHLDTDRCELLSADLLVRGRTSTSVDERARGSVDGALGACFPEGLDLSESGYPITAFPIRGRVHGALNKTPALGASRSLIAEPYSEAGFGVWMEGMRYVRSNGRYFAAPGLTVEQRYHWRGWPADTPTREEVVADAYFFRVARRRHAPALADRAIDIFGFGFHGVQGETGVAVGEFWPLRISGLGIGSDRVMFDFVMGVTAPGTLTDEDGDVIDSANVPERTIAFARTALTVGDRALAAGARYDRMLDTNLLSELVQEDRGMLWMHSRHGVASFAASALFTRALYFPDKTTRGEERLVGGTFDGSYALGGGVSVGLAIEATHAITRDASLDGRVVPDGIRAFATVSYTQQLASYVPAAR